jgi:hypothetical protein
VLKNVLSEARLRTLLRDVASLYDEDDPGDLYWPPSNRWPSMTFVLAERRARRTLYITKQHGLLGIEINRFPEDVTLLYRYGVASPAYVERIARECPSKRLEFIGDLDPCDLTVYLALSSRLARKGIAVEHLGVGDRWLARCQNIDPAISHSRRFE